MSIELYINIDDREGYWVNRTLDSPSAADMARLSEFDYAQFVDYSSINIQASQELKGSTLAFRMRLYTDAVYKQGTGMGLGGRPIPECGNEVIMYDVDGLGNRTREFGGVLVRCGFSRTGNDYEDYELLCTDYTYLLDRRYLNLVLRARKPNKDAGTQIIDLLEHLSDKARNERDAGDSHYNAMWISATASNATTGKLRHGGFNATTEELEHPEGAPVISTINASNQTPSQVIDTIASQAGYIWYVDYYKEVVFLPVGDNTNEAPLPEYFIAVNEDRTGDIRSTFGDYFPPTLLLGEDAVDAIRDTDSYFNHTETESVESVGTKIVLAGTRVQTRLPTTEMHTMERRDIQRGYFETSDNPYANESVISLERQREGSADYVYWGLDSGGNRKTLLRFVTSVDQVGEPRDGEAVLVRGSKYSTNLLSVSRVYFGSDVLEDDVMEMVFNKTEVKSYTSNTSPGFITEMARRTGGDGIHEYTYSRLTGLELQDSEQASNVAQAFLRRKEKPIVTGSFETYIKGWQPGQSFARLDRDAGTHDILVYNENTGATELQTVSVRPPQVMYVVKIAKEVETPHTYTNGRREARIRTTVDYSNIAFGVNA